MPVRRTELYANNVQDTVGEATSSGVWRTKFGFLEVD
jgi:hypothetical protein